MVDNVMYEAEKDVSVNVIYETVDEPKADTLNTPESQELPDKKQSLIFIQNLINSDKSDITSAHITETRALNNVQPTAVSVSEDGNYQPMIPPRRFYKDKDYQCLSPVEDHKLIQLESKSRPSSETNSGKETRSVYQSLVKDSQIDNLSGDYQSLAEFTLQ